MALEGGYNLDAISESVAACVRALLGDKICDLEGSLPYDTTYKTIDDVRCHISGYLFILLLE
jgi:acetoin utilization deacetylase AcuC-like enzyme